MIRIKEIQEGEKKIAKKAAGIEPTTRGEISELEKDLRVLEIMLPMNNPPSTSKPEVDEDDGGKTSENQDGVIATDNRKQATIDEKYESHVLPTDLQNENSQINHIKDNDTLPIQKEKSVIEKAEKKRNCY